MPSFAQESENSRKNPNNNGRVLYYRYQYAMKGDSIQLTLIDSTEVFKNERLRTISVKKFIQKENKTITEQIFLNINRQDSIHRWSEKNKLIKVEEHKYDHLGRLTTSSVKDFLNPKNNLACKYIFTDTMTATGKITTMMAFRTYAKMLNSLDYTIKTYYNLKGDTIRVVRKDLEGEKDLFGKNTPTYKRTSSDIVYKQEVSIDKKELKNQPKLIRKYMQAIKPKIKDPKFITLDYTFATSDSSIQVIIKKNRRENVQKAEVIVQE
jgi:hypothetical protein